MIKIALQIIYNLLSVHFCCIGNTQGAAALQI